MKKHKQQWLPREKMPDHWRRRAISVHTTDDVGSALDSYLASFPFKVGASSIVEALMKEKLVSLGYLEPETKGVQQNG